MQANRNLRGTTFDMQGWRSSSPPAHGEVVIHTRDRSWCLYSRTVSYISAKLLSMPMQVWCFPFDNHVTCRRGKNTSFWLSGSMMCGWAFVAWSSTGQNRRNGWGDVGDEWYGCGFLAVFLWRVWRRVRRSRPTRPRGGVRGPPLRPAAAATGRMWQVRVTGICVLFSPCTGPHRPKSCRNRS
jgi:hypothetical protein